MLRILTLAAASFAASCGARSDPAPPTVRVFAAASLGDLATELASIREASGLPPLDFQLGGSNGLARQIEAGAAADLFLAADLATARAAAPTGARLVYWLSNQLVVVAPSTGGPRSLDEALGARGAIAVGGPGVPAGEYARRALAGRVRLDEARDLFVEFADVRAALAQVAAGAAACGIVYRTDALAARDRVRIIEELQLPDGEGASYVIVPLTELGDEAARWLTGTEEVWTAAAALGFKRHPRAGERIVD